MTIEERAHDLAIALISSHQTAKFNDEIKRLSKNGISHDAIDYGDFLENYLMLYNKFKEELAKN